MQQKIINWIKKQLKETKARGLVVGLSGGLDSAVVASLAKKAIGKERLLTLILPCQSQKEDLKDAKFVAKELGIKAKIIDLTKIYKQLIKILPKSERIAQANLKARLRMLTLYYFANRLNYLVCGTSNKSELKVGYFTKYGDGAADILPIADLLKSQVRKLAYDLGIPERIINKVPTAGLWPGQTDEAEMGLSYNDLDSILEYLENKKGYLPNKEKINKVKAMIHKSEHKRQIPKICYI